MVPLVSLGKNTFVLEVRAFDGEFDTDIKWANDQDDRYAKKNE